MKSWWLLLISRSSRDSATTGVGEQWVPVHRQAVRGQDQGAVGAFVDQLVEVAGLGGGELAHREAVEHEHGGSGEFA